MLQRVIVMGVLLTIVLGCNQIKDNTEMFYEAKHGVELFGYWNIRKVTKENKYAHTVRGYDYIKQTAGNHYLVESGWIQIDKGSTYKRFANKTDSLMIMHIAGKYPIYFLDVKANYEDYINDEYVTMWHYGTILVHFIDENSFWLENRMTKELAQVNSCGLRFGSDKIYYRAEQVDEMVKGDLGGEAKEAMEEYNKDAMK